MKILVIKIGGSVQKKLPNSFYHVLSELLRSGTCFPILVHGGGPEINQLLDKLAIETSFINGLRVTSKEVLEIVEMVLSGHINKKVVTSLHKQQVPAVGLSGVDHRMLLAEPLDSTGKLGFVGTVTQVQTDFLKQLLQSHIVPVISPIGIDDFGQHYNINGDMAASAIAKAIGGKLIFISDVSGVMEKRGEKVILHDTLTAKETELMIHEKIISGGMIPKVRSALSSLSNEVNEAVILNGLVPNDLCRYLNGEKVGTKFLYEEEYSYV